MNSYLKIGAAIVAVLLIVSLILLLPSHQKIRIKWESVFGGDKNEDGWFVLPTDDKGCIITGYTESYGSGERDIWLIKVDENGNEQWNKTFGGKGWDEGKAVQKSTDGGYVIVGSTASYGNGESDVWLIKVDENGNEQ
ncbi:MAG TPA: hypothetical protein ENI45_02680, partial [Thermoplasmatales archaeon]|nr:hypothetical protein [Thermoplasmatales archaeon]